MKSAVLECSQFCRPRDALGGQVDQAWSASNPGEMRPLDLLSGKISALGVQQFCSTLEREAVSVISMLR